MKIILSRKGFDNSNGGRASPIMPDERLLSLPIPVTKKKEKGIPYSKLRFDGQSLSEVIRQLSKGNFSHKETHLDPDLDRDRLLNRGKGWKRTFGQQDGAQTHLKDVKKGDLFLFFGWFRRTKYEGAGLKYVPPKKGGTNLHVIFGWLQVGDILNVEDDQNLETIPSWLHYHPHIVNRGIYPNNTIYIAPEHLTLEGHNLSARGGGTFPCFKRSLQLTDPGRSMRYWRLPKWFYPFDSFGQPQRTPLSYHGRCESWTLHNDHVLLKTAAPGQEFVFDTEEYPEAIEWLKGLFENYC